MRNAWRLGRALFVLRKGPFVTPRTLGLRQCRTVISDVAITVQRFISSPPGQLTAGGVLAGLVWKCFERVEAVLTDTTKFEIAVWLVNINLSQNVASWPETFAKIFDRVFGPKYLSWKCFIRSSIATLANVAFWPLVWLTLRPNLLQLVHVSDEAMVFLPTVSGLVICLDFLMLIKTRFILKLLKGGRSFVTVCGLTVSDACIALFV